MARIQDLIDERARIVKQMRDVIRTTDAEKRSMNGEEKEKYGILEKEVDRLKEQIDLEERQTKIEVEEFEQERETRRAADDAKRRDVLQETPEQVEKRRGAAFRSWLVGQPLNQEQRSVLTQLRSADPEIRALSSGTDATGGYTVPTGFQNELDKALLQFGGMRQAARVLRTDSGNDLEWPKVDDTGNTGALLAENTQATEQDTTFAQTTLESFMYTSKIVRVSVQLLQDSAINVESELAMMLGERIGRITNTHFTTGDASSKPNGVVTAATDSTVALGDPPSVDKVLDLVHKVDPSYREGARFMFNDLTFAQMRKIISMDGTSNAPNFAWQMGLTPGAPDTILGYPYTINQDMADHSTTNKSVLFGDMSKYVIRDSGTPVVLRLVERWGDFNQVGFVVFTRHDGDLVSGSANVIKWSSVS